jgi:hypothetical protein
MEEEIIPNLDLLEFYVLTPNGKRIRAEKMCEEFERNPDEGYAYRTFDNRLVLVVEAVFPFQPIYNGTMSVMVNYTPEKVYWRQAFYLSTGESSSMPSTWLPFSGIIINAKTMRSIRTYDKTVSGTSWFSKLEYISGSSITTDRYQIRFPRLNAGDRAKLEELDRLYGRLYLPEGNVLEGIYRNPFDRWGTPSFALASHALGGYFFVNPPHSPHGGGDILFYNYSHISEYQKVIQKLNKNSPPQRCFRFMQRNYSPTNILTINQYIDKHQAIPIMNAFRDIGVFPPGLSFIQVPFEGLPYSMPITDYYYMLLEVVFHFWKLYKLQKISAEKVRSIFSNPQSLLKGYLTKERRTQDVFPNEPHYKYKLRTNIIPAKNLPFYGGTRKRKVRKQKTRKVF